MTSPASRPHFFDIGDRYLSVFRLLETPLLAFEDVSVVPDCDLDHLAAFALEIASVGRHFLASGQ